MAEGDSQEERMAWLRDRGIEIELPSDRKREAIPKDGPTRTLKIVKIPADETKNYTEISIPVEESKIGDQLPSILRIFFNQGSVRVDDVKEAAATQLTNQEVKITQKTLDKLSDVGSVEVFPLAHPNEYNNNCKVSFYLDEVGQLKKLAPNHRATQFAKLCGFENVPLVGDMFIGRVGPASMLGLNGSGPVNVDFSLSELSSDAAWLKDVVKHNYEAGLKANRVAMESDLPETDVSAEAEVSGAKGVKWSETSDYVEVSVQLPGEITKFTAKDVVVKISAAQVSIKIKNNTAESIVREEKTYAPNELIVLFESPLAGRVSVDDSTWSISGHTVELSLEKNGGGGMWKKLTA
eukprot:gene8754-10356_t